MLQRGTMDVVVWRLHCCMNEAGGDLKDIIALPSTTWTWLVLHYAALPYRPRSVYVNRSVSLNATLP